MSSFEGCDATPPCRLGAGGFQPKKGEEQIGDGVVVTAVYIVGAPIGQATVRSYVSSVREVDPRRVLVGGWV